MLITLQLIFNLLTLVPPTINYPNAVLTATGSSSLLVQYSR